MKLAKVLAAFGSVVVIVYFGWAMEDRYAPKAEVVRVEWKLDKHKAKKEHEEAQRELWKLEDRYGGEGCPEAQKGEQKERCHTVEQQEKDAFFEMQKFKGGHYVIDQ